MTTPQFGLIMASDQPLIVHRSLLKRKRMQSSPIGQIVPVSPPVSTQWTTHPVDALPARSYNLALERCLAPLIEDSCHGEFRLLPLV